VNCQRGQKASKLAWFASMNTVVVIKHSPISTRSTPNNVACLRKFGGTRAHGRALCSVKSDSARELTEAVKQLGWLPEPGLPNDPYHDSRFESNIRRIKERTRAVHLAAGFLHELWPKSIEYFCVAKSFTTLAPINPNESDEVKKVKQGLRCYEVANGGEPFEGHRVPLGALVYYKQPQHTNRPAFEPRTLPGIFVGWRICSGFKHRKIHLVLDYESVRTNAKGYERPIQVHATELVVPESHIFPLFQAEQAKKLKGVQVCCQRFQCHLNKGLQQHQVGPEKLTSLWTEPSVCARL
jgi:hypothetical protein